MRDLQYANEHGLAGVGLSALAGAGVAGVLATGAETGTALTATWSRAARIAFPLVMGGVITFVGGVYPGFPTVRDLPATPAPEWQ